MEAAILANYAAGVVVGKVGTATTTPQELLKAFLLPAKVEMRNMGTRGLLWRGIADLHLSTTQEPVEARNLRPRSGRKERRRAWGF